MRGEERRKLFTSSTTATTAARGEKHRRLNDGFHSPCHLPFLWPYLVLRGRCCGRGGLSGRVGGGSRRVGDRRGRGHDRVFCRQFSFPRRRWRKKDGRSVPWPGLSVVRDRWSASGLQTCLRTRAGGGGRSAARDPATRTRWVEEKKREEEREMRERKRRAAQRKRSSISEERDVSVVEKHFFFFLFASQSSQLCSRRRFPEVSRARPRWPRAEEFERSLEATLQQRQSPLARALD